MHDVSSPVAAGSFLGTISEKEVGGRVYTRIPIRTHLVMFGEPLDGLIEKYVASQIDESAILCLSQKLVSICENNVRHISDVKASWLAHFITRFVTKYPEDIGYSHPKKMQVAIDEVGYLRMIAAVIIGGISKFVFSRRGDFYRIAGHHISEIDGFNPAAMKPFDEYAMLPPRNPNSTCEAVAQKFKCACYMIDGNNINVEVVGASRNMAERGLDKDLARELMLDNPMGQDDELTPIFILRLTGLSKEAAPSVARSAI
jgi:hypothetical protein